MNIQTNFFMSLKSLFLVSELDYKWEKREGWALLQYHSLTYSMVKGVQKINSPFSRLVSRFVLPAAQKPGGKVL